MHEKRGDRSGHLRHRWVGLLFWLAYPLIIFIGMRFFEPRVVALLLAGLLIARHGRFLGRFMKQASRLNLGIFLMLLLVSGVSAVTNDEFFLRLYPVAVNVGLLALFGVSLMFPPPLVERLARLAEPDLPIDGVRYTRRVTQAWCLFFAGNGVMAAYTAFLSSREFWALYNGLIAYGLMALLFAVEWLVRRRFRRRAGAPGQETVPLEKSV